MSPVGCELIVQGITPKGGLTAADIVRNAISTATTATTALTISVKDKELHKITIMSSNGSIRPECDAFCYIQLAAVVAEVSEGPHPDLLEPWIDVIQDIDRNWEARWSPCKAGQDKATWVCLHGLPVIPGLPTRQSGRKDPRIEERCKTVIAELIKLGFPAVSSWIMDKGEAAGVILRSTADVECIIKVSPIQIRSLAPHPIYINSPFRQIEPSYAFELAVCGAGAYDSSFKDTLDTYFLPPLQRHQ